MRQKWKTHFIFYYFKISAISFIQWPEIEVQISPLPNPAVPPATKLFGVRSELDGYKLLESSAQNSASLKPQTHRLTLILFLQNQKGLSTNTNSSYFFFNVLREGARCCQKSSLRRRSSLSGSTLFQQN